MENNNPTRFGGFFIMYAICYTFGTIPVYSFKDRRVPCGKETGGHMPNRMNMSTVEERLTKVETNLANLADAQRDVSQALNKVSESIHAIQISIERQNASIHQIVELRRDVDAMSKDVDKLKGKVWWLGGVAAACTFIIVNFSRLKDLFH